MASNFPIISDKWRGFRTSSKERPRVYRFGDFVFDESRQRLSRSGVDVPLTKQATIVLALLLRHAGTLVTRERLENELWPAFPPAHPSQGINNIISKLRQALDDPPEQSALIRNTAKSGYEFCGALVALTDHPSLPAGAALVFTAAVSTGIALFTSAVGTAAIGYFVFTGLLIVAFDRLKDTAVIRGAISTVLFLGMAYIPSAWTLYQLSGDVINFDAVPPAAIYPFVTGMKFLPLFALVLMWWTVDAMLPPRTWWLRSVATFWAAASLFVGMTAASLVAYSGEAEIITGTVRGWTRLVLGYAAVLAVNIAFGALALRIMRGGGSRQSQRLLVACAAAYVTLLLPAVVIGHEYNTINRHFLSSRRPAVYRPRNPESLNAILRDTHRQDIGPDLRHLLENPHFADALRRARFYRVDLDERFQVLRHAVTFGYEDRNPAAELPMFRLVRFPADVAAALNFQRTRE